MEVDAFHAWVLFFLCAAGIALRVRYLFLPMRYDEAFTYLYYARKPLVVGMSFYSAPNNHVFHTVLVHFAVLLLGNHPWAVRLPALVAGALLLPFSYVAFRKVYGRESALLTVAFLTASAPLVEYSADARGYSAICICFVLLVWLGAELLEAGSISRWICFVGVAAIGFYTIPTMLYPFAMVVTWMAIGAWRLRLGLGFFWRLLVACLTTAIAAGILYLPVIVV
jgi:4-amino-4-deoxy-L-arabinose transferase-like glycosyltransferase